MQRWRISNHRKKVMAALLSSLLLMTISPVSGQDVKLAELTPEVEKAIDRGLQSLLESQQPDGSWGNRFKVASTSLALMAFMVKGQFPGHPPNGNSLSRAIDYLVTSSNNRPDGFMGVSMYEHGLATLALSEVCGMVPRQDVHKALKKSVGLILAAQNGRGGWRYMPQPLDSDVSATVMQIVALASAKEAGIMVPDEVIAKALEYVTSCHDETSGGFCYRSSAEEIHSRTPAVFGRSAAGVLSLMMCGQRDSEIVKNGMKYLVNRPDEIFSNTSNYFYGHYYAIQVMYQAGDEHYQAWYPKIRDALIAKQQANGSWQDQQMIGTQAAILILGVPYRFLPIYQR